MPSSPNVCADFLAQVVAFEFQLVVEASDLLQGAAIPNGHGRVRREGRQPRQHVPARWSPQVAHEDSNDTTPEQQRISEDAANVGGGGAA